jgi:hypothetical protein
MTKLGDIHDNEEEDFVQIDHPLGTEKFVAEVHLPPTREFRRHGTKLQLMVYEVLVKTYKKSMVV